MMRLVQFSHMFDMWSDSSVRVLRGWQCPEILHMSLQPGFTTGVKLSAQIIPFFICRNSPADMIYKYSSCKHEIQGQPRATNQTGFASLFTTTYWCHRKGHILNPKLQITNIFCCNEVLSFICVTVSGKIGQCVTLPRETGKSSHCAVSMIQYQQSTCSPLDIALCFVNFQGKHRSLSQNCVPAVSHCELSKWRSLQYSL